MGQRVGPLTREADLVGLGILETYLGDGVIEKIVAKGLRNGRLPLRERL